MMKKLIAFVILVMLMVILPANTAFGSRSGAKVLLNNVEISTDVKIINGKPYVEAGSYSEAVGLKTDWDEKNDVLNVTSASNDTVIPDIVKNISPSVVGIIGKYSADSDYNGYRYNDNIIYGTGVIIKSNGEILTNAHVVQHMDPIVVVLSSGDGYEAEIKYLDADSDLAVVKIAKSGLTAAKLGTENEIVTGKTVIAIGTPISFSLRNSASIGIISGVNRGIDSYYKLIQTDASINPGNSGGPLVSLQGNVIGIDSSKYAGEGIEGMGFAIPVSTVKYVLDQFDRYGRVKRPYLGAVFEEDWAAKIGFPTNTGLTVKSTDSNSPAAAYGLKAGDILFKVDGIPVNTIVDYNEAMKSYEPGSKAELTIRRGGTDKTISITFGEEK